MQKGELLALAERDRPSAHGAIVGRALTALVDASGCSPQMCATCAFRPDCMTNQMAGTTLAAFKCAAGVDDSPFGCHHGMVDGQPTKLCEGWLAAKSAPYPALVNISGEMVAELDAISGPDTVREKFDAWLSRVDPECTLDDYQRGRLWLRARAALVEGVEG